MASSCPPPRRAAAVLLAALAAVPSAAAPSRAQLPYIVDEDQIGRTPDQSTLRFCIDPRDPNASVDQAVGEAIAAALLVEPRPFVVQDPSVRADFDRLYRHLREDCDVYFGFKLISGAYPPWLTVTRPYLQEGYRFIVKEPGWTKLADIPRTEALGPTIGTSADFRLIQYLQSLGPSERWRRFPMSTDDLALRLLENGTVAAALVWEPSFNRLKAANPAYADLRAIDADPLPPTVVPVGAAILAQNVFLRSSVDQAIASLIADGTLEEILAASEGGATVPD